MRKHLMLLQQMHVHVTIAYMADGPQVALPDADDGLAAELLAAQWHALLARYHHTSCALERELQAQHDLSVSEFEILQQLVDTGGECGSVRMTELADHVHLSQSALSRLVSRLQADSLVERSTCTDDRRAIFLNITPAGRGRYLAARPTQRAVLREQAGSPL